MRKIETNITSENPGPLLSVILARFTVVLIVKFSTIFAPFGPFIHSTLDFVESGKKDILHLLFIVKFFTVSELLYKACRVVSDA